MTRLRRFLNLGRDERGLLSTALFWVCTVRLALWVLPFRVVHHIIRLIASRGTFGLPMETPARDKIVWAVRLASRHVPSATCLTQALAAYLMLSQKGQPTSLYLGVSKTMSGTFEAHAWVEFEGRILIGNLENFTKYAPMRLMNGESL
jgi:Transglutaminase-like superfamily